MNYKIMGRNIAKIRTQNHLTQEQLAEKIDVSTVFISQIETAVRKPSLETIYKLSVALDCTIDTLIGNETLNSKCDEIAKLVDGRSNEELAFITGVMKDIMSRIENGKIKNDWFNVFCKVSPYS